MTQEAIYAKLQDILKTVKPDLGIDTRSMLVLSLAIEHEYGFQFQTQAPFKTVREVVEYIEKAIQ